MLMGWTITMYIKDIEDLQKEQVHLLKLSLMQLRASSNGTRSVFREMVSLQKDIGNGDAMQREDVARNREITELMVELAAKQESGCCPGEASCVLGGVVGKAGIYNTDDGSVRWQGWKGWIWILMSKELEVKLHPGLEYG